MTLRKSREKTTDNILSLSYAVATAVHHPRLEPHNHGTSQLLGIALAPPATRDLQGKTAHCDYSVTSLKLVLALMKGPHDGNPHPNAVNQYNMVIYVQRAILKLHPRLDKQTMCALGPGGESSTTF